MNRPVESSGSERARSAGGLVRWNGGLEIHPIAYHAYKGLYAISAAASQSKGLVQPNSGNVDLEAAHLPSMRLIGKESRRRYGIWF